MNETVDALERLARLRGEGTISESEFLEAKSNVLKGVTPPSSIQKPKTGRTDAVLKTLAVVGVIAITLLIVIGQFVDDIDLDVRLVAPGDETTIVFVTSKNTAPLKIERLLINGRAGMPGCDFRSDMDQKNRDLFKPTLIRDKFPNGQALKMGEGFNFTTFGCGTIEKLEVHTDQGDGSYSF